MKACGIRVSVKTMKMVTSDEAYLRAVDGCSHMRVSAVADLLIDLG